MVVESDERTVALEPGARERRPSGGRDDSDVLERGALVGRYVVIDRLGSGAMGVVYRAYDPELDRKVALKLLRARSRARDPESGADRLLREAQAMARLHHPNIITVHDVGTLDDRVFVAMELVDGPTLKAWMREGPRRWTEVLPIFIGAGRGLAAAHDAALVHRDFKPDNVLLATDGSVFVSDFGLARLASQPSVRIPPSADDSISDELTASRRLDVRLTQTGTVVGTPAYMAPEQYLKAEPDGRADQFSFCVALYEALYGKRPFSGRSIDELTSAVMRDRVDEAPKGARVPRWLRRIVLRGLRSAPDQRYPSMQALVADLERRPTLARRRTWVVGGAVLFAAAAVLGYRHLEARQRALCEEGDDALAGAWNREQRRALHDSLIASNKPYAADSAEAVTGVLDEYAQAWATTRSEACQATRIRGEQSERLLHQQSSCLDEKLTAMRELVRILVRADASVVERAVAATYALERPERCMDEAIASGDEPVWDRQGRDIVDWLDIRRKLAQATSWRSLGEYERGLEPASAALDDARRLGEHAAEGEALILLGELRARAGDRGLAEHTVYEAIWSADAHRNDRLGARGWVTVTALVAEQEADHAEALELARTAEAAIVRAGGHEGLEATLDSVVGRVLAGRGNHAEALVHQQRALEIRERVLGPRHPLVAETLDELAETEGASGRSDRAVANRVRALAIAEGTVGPAHPETGRRARRLGDALMAQGDEAQARMHWRRADAIEKAAREP